jgi:hypothetical protein
MRKKHGLPATQQVIDHNKTYSLSGFMATAGWGRMAMRTARAQGLRVVRVAGRCYVRGSDFADFLGRLFDDQEGGAA